MVGSSKLPFIVASYHCMFSPITDKSATFGTVQKVCSESPVGASGEVTFIVIYSLQVTPLVVTSTQYSVVSVGFTEIVSVVSPVDQIT